MDVKEALLEKIILGWLVSIMVVLLIIGHRLSMVHWVLLGAIIGTIGHAITESLFDSFLSQKHPFNYPVYSTGISAGIFLTIVALLLVCWRWENFTSIQYLVMGLFAVEIANLIDIIRVWIILKGEEREK